MLEHSLKQWSLESNSVDHQIPLNVFRPWFSLNRSKIFKIIISMVFFVSGCIHTQSYERKTLEMPSESSTNPIFENDLVSIKSVVYMPSKLPLSDFFLRLRKGEFKEAFRRVDLTYNESNFDNEVLQQIIDDGFIPAYIEVFNKDTKPLIFDEKDFVLSNGIKTVKGFYSDELPHEFKKFNTTAAAANVYNVSVVTVGFLAVLVGMVAVAGNATGGQPDFSQSNGLNPQNNFLNKTTKITSVDYKNLLISNSKLDPGASKKGLLFFYLGDTLDLKNYKMIFLHK
jgi:hypothetical protein